MADLDSRKLAIDYLRQIQYQKQKNVSCQTIQDQWQQILVAGGQQNLIGLAKLRHQWNTDLDPFLADHTYPRNISSIYDYSLLKLEFQDFPDTELQKAYQKLISYSFRKKSDLVTAVRKQIRRSLSEDELEFLDESIQSKWVGRCLNLIVYDASLQQSFRLEQEAYIKLFQRLLPGWDLVEIRCQISDPLSFRRDEENLEQLKESWSSLESNFSQFFFEVKYAPPAPPCLTLKSLFNSLVLFNQSSRYSKLGVNLNNSSGSVLRGTTKNEFFKSI